MLARSASKLKSVATARRGSRFVQTKAPRRPNMAALKEKYGENAHLFYKELHPQIKYFDACTCKSSIYEMKFCEFQLRILARPLRNGATWTFILISDGFLYVLTCVDVVYFVTVRQK